MTVDGVAAVAGVECRKLAAQVKTRVALVASVVGPFAFATAVQLQSSVPSDTLFGRAVKESGLATPLVILGFAALWALPVLASMVGGDLFASEDRYDTWKMILTRSRTRDELFAGKVIAALAFSCLAVTVFAASSIAAGVAVIGAQPLINLSGIARPASEALPSVALAWASVLPPVCAVTALAALTSVATRNSAAGMGLPVLAALVMQLSTLIDGPELPRRALITSAFGAWHGLLAEPRYYGPLFDACLVSGAYCLVSLTVARRLLRQRNIGG